MFYFLKRDRQGQHRFRINEQWRICFEWKDGNPFNIVRSPVTANVEEQH